MEQKGVRYTIPTRYDLAPFGQVCKVMGDDESVTLYIQTGHDQDTSTWVPMSIFLEKVFKSFLDDPTFIKECLEIYHNNPNYIENLKTLSNIIKDKLLS
jgi:hypothetical protein